MGKFASEFGGCVLHGGICIGGFAGIVQRLLRGGYVGLCGLLNLGTEFRELLALLISKAHFMAPRTGGVLTGFLRVLSDRLLLLRGVRELLILLRGCGFRCVCGLLRLGLRLFRGLRGGLGLLLRLARLLRGLLILTLLFAAGLRGLFGGGLRTLRFGRCLLGCLSGFASFVRGVLGSVGRLLRTA